MPKLATKITIVIYAITYITFSAIAEPYSKADACYTLLNMPAMVSLEDPMVMQKTEVCVARHGMIPADIAEKSAAFRYLYRKYSILLF